MIKQVLMYHFAWAHQKEKQGYKFDVSLKRRIQLVVVPWEIKLWYKPATDATFYIDTAKPTIDCGFEFVSICKDNSCFF